MPAIVRTLALWIAVLGTLPAACAQNAEESEAKPGAPSSPAAPRPASPQPARTPAPSKEAKGPEFKPVHYQITGEPDKQEAPKSPGPPRIPVPPHLRPFHVGEEHLKVPTPPVTPHYTDNLFGTWCDLLPALNHDGITPSLSFITECGGNPVGGIRHGFTEADNLGFGLNADLERLWGLHGGSLVLTMNSRSGASLSHIDVGNVFNVQEQWGGEVFRLVDMTYEQSLCDDRLDVKLGRMAANDDFLSSPYYWAFLQNGIDGTPVGIFFTVPGMTAYPVATWGLRLKARPVKEVYVMAGFYNGDPNVGLIDRHGVDFTLHGPLFFITEVGYQPNRDKDAPGLPGTYKVGYYYDGARFNRFVLPVPGATLPPPLPRGNFGLYFLADQVVYQRGGPDSKQDLGLFAAVIVAPQEFITTMPFFFDGGILFRGPFRWRPLDYAAFGLVCGEFSPDLQRVQRAAQQTNPAAGVQTYELALEWTYTFHIASGVRLQPDVQYIINPGATGLIPNSLVLGVRMSINF
jgi:porin